MTSEERWKRFIARANLILNQRRGAKSAVARALGIARQDLHRILTGVQEPRASIALALHEALRKEARQNLEFSSESVEWPTPRWLFDCLHEIFDFNLDVAATVQNAKCPRYFTREENGLLQTWASSNWCNPPYGRPQWLKKAFEESRRGAVVVCLIAARPDTRAWHSYVEAPGNTVIFIEGRLTFDGAEHPAPFPSALVVMGSPIPGGVIKEAVRSVHRQHKQSLSGIVPEADRISPTSIETKNVIGLSAA